MVQSPLMTKESKWAYSTVLPSPHGATNQATTLNNTDRHQHITTKTNYSHQQQSVSRMRKRQFCLIDYIVHMHKFTQLGAVSF